jgi:phosphatidylserine synthase
MTLATYYWFSQTPLYTQTMISDLPWHVMLRYIMLGLGFLMISNVSYAAVPTIGYRTMREVLGSLLVIGTIVGVIFLPWQFFFPALMAYVRLRPGAVSSGSSAGSRQGARSGGRGVESELGPPAAGGVAGAAAMAGSRSHPLPPPPTS